MEEIREVQRVQLPLLALRGLVLFPNMVLHFDVGRKKSVLALNKSMQEDHLIYLVAQKDVVTDDPAVDDLYEVGVVAQVKQILKMPGDNLRVIVEGLYRAKIETIESDDPFLIANVTEVPLEEIADPYSLTLDALKRSVKEKFEAYCVMSPKIPKEIVLNILSSEDPNYIAEYIAGNIMFPTEDKQAILELSDVQKRLEKLLVFIERETNLLSIEKELYEKVRDQLDQNQREYYLREQLKIISNELGEGESPQDEAVEYKYAILALGLEEEAEEKLLKEADRLSKMPSNSQEANVIRTYLETCLELPWSNRSKDKIDVKKAEKILGR